MGWFAATLFVAVLAASSVGVRLALWLLRRRSILDLPNERSSHHVATPRGGGLAVVSVLMIAWPRHRFRRRPGPDAGQRDPLRARRSALASCRGSTISRDYW